MTFKVGDKVQFKGAAGADYTVMPATASASRGYAFITDAEGRIFSVPTEALERVAPLARFDGTYGEKLVVRAAMGIKGAWLGMSEENMAMEDIDGLIKILTEIKEYGESK